MTYHVTYPDGRTVKKHLNSFLTRLRNRFPDVAYLWVLEFQLRGVPHFHMWLSLPHDLPGLGDFLAKTWNKIADPGNAEHLAWHSFKGQPGWETCTSKNKLLRKKKPNLMPWDMYSSGYLTKYLDKASQKAIPEGFTGCGRFWGNSRGLLATPDEKTPADLSHMDQETVDEETGEIITRSAFSQALRIICKHHEKKLKKRPYKSFARTSKSSYTLGKSAPALRSLLSYLQRSYEQINNIPF
jgi:hypothetical protein